MYFSSAFKDIHQLYYGTVCISDCITSLQWNFPFTGSDAIFTPSQPSSPRQLTQGNFIRMTELKQQ